MLTKNISILWHSTLHPVNIHIKKGLMIERHMPDVKVVEVERGGLGTKHRKCFFHGNRIIKYFVVHIVVIYNSGT